MNAAYLKEREDTLRSKCVLTSQGCWEWMGGFNTKGTRGMMRYGGKRQMAYRVSYKMAGRMLKDTETLDHLCCNPGCVNPAHLEPCSHSENCRRNSSNAKPVVLKGAA